MDPVLAGWRHGTKRGPGPRWLIVLLISSPTILCWWYLHLRAYHYQLGDLALHKEDLITVDPALAGWRHGTKRGPGPRWFIIFLISSPTIL